MSPQQEKKPTPSTAPPETSAGLDPQATAATEVGVGNGAVTSRSGARS